MIRRLCALLLLIGGLSACETANVQEQHAAARFAAALSGATVRSFSPYHGNQIEYHDPEGRAFLWYPGNQGPVPSRWKVTNGDICYKYPSNSYNPVTDEFGGKWECRPWRLFVRNIDEVIAGDPFDLASGKLPFRLTRSKQSITAAELFRRMGKNPKTLTYRTFSNDEETTQ